MALYKKSQIDDIAEIIQSDLDAILSVAEKIIFTLPNQTVQSHPTSFVDALMQNNMFYLGTSSKHFLRHAKKYYDTEGFVSRSEADDNIIDYIDDIFLESSSFFTSTHDPYILKLSDIMAYFFVYADKSEMDRFINAQGQVLENFLDDLADPSRQKIKDIEDIMADYGVHSAVALVEYIRETAENHPDTPNFIFLKQAAPWLGEHAGIFSAHLYDETIAALNNFQGNIFEELSNIRKKCTYIYGAEDNYKILAVILARPDLFADNESLAPVYDFFAFGNKGLETEWVANEQDLGFFIQSKLDNKYELYRNSSVKHGSYSHLYLKLLVDNDRERKRNLFKKRKQEIQRKIPYAVLHVSSLKPANNIASGVGDIFSAETGRPARPPRSSETGGRSGLGKQKPHLWKPE